MKMRPGFKKPVDNSSDSADEAQAGERLQKVLAAAGLGSRRKCESLISEGRVEVDRQVVDELGARVQADQEVRVDGTVLTKRRLVHFLVHKPRGVVCTNYDQSGRPRVIDLLPPREDRLYPVGRLDMSSEGLILVTNDGELANHLTHPRYGVHKTYQVEVAGELDPQALAKLTKGVHLAEGFAKAVSVKIKSSFKQSTLLEIVLAEGKNREIRRILARVGHKVLRIKRVAIGPLKLSDLPPGGFRPLMREEVKALRESTGGETRTRRPVSKRRAPGKRPMARPLGRPALRTASLRTAGDKAASAGPRGVTIIGGSEPSSPREVKRKTVRHNKPSAKPERYGKQTSVGGGSARQTGSNGAGPRAKPGGSKTGGSKSPARKLRRP